MSSHPYWFDILVGNTPVPDKLYLSPECRHQHGVAGKTLRYKSNKQCVYCSAEVHKRLNNQRYASCGNAVRAAAHLRDELLLQRQLKEVWE